MLPCKIRLENLPSEIFDLICQHIPRKSCANLAQTSRHFWIATVPHIWNTNVDAIDLVGLFPTAVVMKANGTKTWKPYANNIQCIQRCYARFAFYAQYVIGVNFTSVGRLHNVDEGQQRRWLNWALEYTASRPFRSKLRLLRLYLDSSNGYPFQGLSWLGLFMSPSLESFATICKSGDGSIPEASIALLQYIFGKMLRRCSLLKDLGVSSTLLSSTTISNMSRLSHLESLAIHGPLRSTNFTPTALPLLQKFELKTNWLYPAQDLCKTLIFTCLKHAVIAVELHRYESITELFRLVVNQSSGIELLSILLPPTGFQLSMLGILSPLKLRRLAFTKDGPYVECPNILHVVGTLWPNLEYLAAPFNVSSSDLLSISRCLPQLRHLAVGVVIGDIRVLDLPIQKVWKSLPKHELVIWTRSMISDIFEDTSMQNYFDDLARLLAAVWPNMRLFVANNVMYQECLRKEIAMHSRNIFKSHLPQGELNSGTKGWIDTAEMWAYTEGLCPETGSHLDRFK